ncbi:low affinity Fe/Cu permease [Rhizobium aquaticum]|uniref:Low affinity Fe/Cu permease n=1 Tax=Rhizobium aquaticum TaxID=1549636 RepID=A0ABV2IWW0_9HYPH
MADVTKLFSKFATRTSKLAGKPATFVLAVTLVVAWAATGPLFGFSDVWQLVINTSTTIITFLMIFVLQNSQNRDSEAIQAKLDELILVGAAHNRLVGVEKLDERELDKLKRELEQQAEEIGEEQEERAAEMASNT